ncbi:hypothetical protein B0H14DRAFT_3428125 [Mycena olivaceomarginata]|nr:hypothetical protein B0H14DRAFT_3428125 [Mycena olivaceomarginata]
MSDSESPMVVVAPQLRALEEASRRHITLHAPLVIRNALGLILAYSTVLRMITPPPDRPIQPNIQYNVKLNKRTTLEKLYIHDSDVLIEFPETSSSGSVGHLFRIEARLFMD